jgi:hypothetical protein
MTGSEVVAARLSDEQLGEFQALTRDADSVELKVTVPAEQHRPTIARLGIDPLQAEIRQVFFFDTPDLDLYAEGVVVRARRMSRKGEDSTVKLRPVVPGDVPKQIRRSSMSKVEVDALPGGFVCSAALGSVPREGAVRAAALGDLPIRKLFSKDQKRFYAQHAPEGIRLDDLWVLGPIFVLKTKFVPKALGRKLTAEYWLYPDDSRVVELSTKCAPADAFQAAAETRIFLADQDIDLTGEQEPKTLKALEFFSERLAATEPITAGR